MPDTNTTKPRLGGRKQRQPRTLKQHLLRRVLMVIPAVLLVLIVHKTGLLDLSYDKITFNKMSWFDNTALVEHLRLKVTEDGLTDLPRHCLVFVVNGTVSDNNPQIEVLGRHGNGCPGEKPSADKLFNLKIDRMERTILTDANSPGVFRPIPG